MGRENYIRVIYKAPEKAPEWRLIPNELESFQALVKGHLEVAVWDDGHLIVVNEEGKLQHMDYNFVWFENADCIMGPCFWVAQDGEEFASILDDGFFDRITDYTGYGPENPEDDIEIGVDLKDLIAEMEERRREK